MLKIKRAVLRSVLWGASLLTLIIAAPTFAQPRNIIDNRVADSINRGIAGSIDSRLQRYELQIGKTKGTLTSAQWQSGTNTFLQQFDEGTLVAWDFANGVQMGEFKLPPAARPVLFDPKSASVVFISQGQLLAITRTPTGSVTAERILADRVQAVVASSDGNWIFAGTSDGQVVKLAARGSAVSWRKKILDAAPIDITASVGGNSVTVLDQGHRAIVLDAAGNTTGTLPGIRKLGDYSARGWQYHITESNRIVRLGGDLAPLNHGMRLNGEVALVSWSDSAENLISLSPQGELSLHGSGGVKVVDTNVKYAAFVGERRFISVRNDGVTYLRGTDVDHYLVAIVPSPVGWVIVDHEGRYDGTVAGSKEVVWKGESGEISLDQFFEAYYRPGLLSSYVNSQEKRDLTPVAGKPREGLFGPPKVEIDFPEGKMKAGGEYKVVVVAESQGGDLQDEIQVFHNGKRLPPKSRIGSQKVQRDGRLLLLQIHAFVAESGPNELFAEAKNSHGVASRSAVSRQVAEGPLRPGKLHLVGIGVDKYLVSRINLDFAGADVKAFMAAMNPASGRRNDRIVSRQMLDGQATVQGIKDLFAELASVDPADTLVVIMAGHGATVEDEWYFLPHDVDPDNLPKTALSIRTLQDALVTSPAKRIFLMVDACNSGAGVDGFNRYKAFQRRFVQQIGRGAGISVLTATRRDQFAAELTQLGHGLFTHMLLEGLAGAADTYPKDGNISAHELANFVGENLEQRARIYLEKLGLSQSPAHFVIGADFMITAVKQ